MPLSFGPTTVAVTPVNAVLASVDVGPSELVSVQVENLSATETFTGIIRRANASTNTPAPSTIGDLRGVPPLGTLGPDGEDLSSVVVDCSVPASSSLDVVGKMTGLGGNVRITILQRLSGRQRMFKVL